MGLIIGGQRVAPLIVKAEAELETLNVTPTTSAQTITPSRPVDGYDEVSVAAVTAAIDENIVAGNIKKDVQILGVTGTYGGASVKQPTVRVIDYDGTILKSEKVAPGDTFTLPEAPSHSGLTFHSWSSPITITNGTVVGQSSDLTIGATYSVSDMTPASGLCEFDITLNSLTGLTATLNMDGTKDWGDGTSNTETSHTYSQAGNYTITCNGTTITASSSSGLFGQNNQGNYYVTAARFASVTSIPNFACAYCSSLKEITLPNSVTSIGNGAFRNCGFRTIIIPNDVTMGQQVFNNCSSLSSIVLANGVKIGSASQLFNYCSCLKAIVFPNTASSDSIPTEGLYNCTSLRWVAIPSSMGSSGTSAFYGCGALESVYIPSSWATFPQALFQNCYSMTSLNIPDSITYIGSSALTNCYSLEPLTFPSGVTTLNYTSPKVTSLTLPTSVTTFNLTSCTSLTSVVIPDGITSIPTMGFYGCYSLPSVEIPSSVTSIETYAFYNCNFLESLEFTGNITSIGASAFYNCKSILEYDFSNNTSVPTLSNVNAFQYMNKLCKIKVPSSLVDTWKATTNWVTYADYIVGV